MVHTTAKQAISHHRKHENACEMYKNEKCTCKACKTTVFHCQICKFVTFLLHHHHQGCLSPLIAHDSVFRLNLHYFSWIPSTEQQAECKCFSKQLLRKSKYLDRWHGFSHLIWWSFGDRPQELSCKPTDHLPYPKHECKYHKRKIQETKWQ